MTVSNRPSGNKDFVVEIGNKTLVKIRRCETNGEVAKQSEAKREKIKEDKEPNATKCKRRGESMW